jgi:hypothetical protein
MRVSDESRGLGIPKRYGPANVRCRDMLQVTQRPKYAPPRDAGGIWLSPGAALSLLVFIGIGGKAVGSASRWSARR